MSRGYLAACHGCGVVTTGKTYVRVGRGREAPFCARCLPAARERARQRFHANARRWAHWLFSRTAA